MTLKVHKELPPGVTERPNRLGRLRDAHGMIGDSFVTFHFCPDCDGWIEGHANDYEVNTLNPARLAGRRGTEFFCRRCGYRIDFVGMMS